jgi:hypothetical protein
MLIAAAIDSALNIDMYVTATMVAFGLYVVVGIVRMTPAYRRIVADR